MKFFRAYYVLLISISILLSCRQAPTDAPIIKTQITGKVTDSKTTQAIVGAQITTNPATSSVVTGNDGNYTIPDVKAIQYTITAKKDGYNDNTTTVTVIEGNTVNADIQLFKLSPELEVSPTTLDFETTKNDLSFFITNKGKVGTITWSITTNQPWVTISPTNGTTTAETDPIQVSVSRNNIAIGSYTAQIKITSDAGEKTISVIMVKPDPNLPQLIISPTSIDFGSSMLTSQVELKNTGIGVMNWTSSPSNDWINLSTSKGTINTGDKSIINVTVNKSGLAPGNFNGSVIFNSNGGSKTFSITMVVPPWTAPNMPILSAPSSGSVDQLTSPTLSWNASTDATSYTLQVSQNSAFSSFVFNQNVGNILSKQISGLNNLQTYYWRVSASNSYGTSSFSNTWSFTTIVAGTAPSVPILSAPTNNAINISIPPTLSWNVSDRAASYTLQVSTSNSFPNTVFNQSGLISISQQVSGISNSTTYYWRVNATNNYGTSSWSSIWSFTTGCIATVTYAGKTYNTVQIGNQCWLKENLDIGTMINGSINAINNGTIEKYCYNNDPSNCAKYGGLYQWDEAMEYSITEGDKGICPNGWHIPTKAEYEILNSAVNKDVNALLAIGQTTKSNDASGFSALLSGSLNSYSSYTEYSNLGYTTDFWCSTQYPPNRPYSFHLELSYTTFQGFYNNKKSGYSIRCLKD